MTKLALILTAVFLVQVLLLEVHLFLLRQLRIRFFGERLKPYKLLREIFDLVFYVVFWILVLIYSFMFSVSQGFPGWSALIPFVLFAFYIELRNRRSSDPTRKQLGSLRIARAEIKASFFKEPAVYLKELWQEQKDRNPFIRAFWDVSRPIKILWIVYGLNCLWFFAEFVSLIVQRDFIFMGAITIKDGEEEFDLHRIPYFTFVSIFVMGTLMYFYQFVRALKKIREKYGVNVRQPF
ncbi:MULTISPECIES: hypothetical protein [unclassified Nitrospina]|uniref:hypothetical protein n=1 Tax=unclassified Nitrospina TaxID=2638683 RepID=UPI003F9AF708